MLTKVDGRTARKEQTRDAIRRAAVELFDQHGYDDTTTADIARAAGVSERTFFRHFPTKEEVAFEGHRERLVVLAESLAARPDDEPVLDGIQSAIVALVDEFEAQRAVMMRLRDLTSASQTLAERSNELQNDFTAAVAAHVAARLHLDPETDLVPGVVGNAVAGAILAAVNVWLATGAGHDLPDLTARSLGLLDEGLGLR